MPKSTITTPAHIPELLKKTLVVCLAHRFARAFEFYGKEIKELDQIHTTETDYEYSDRDRINTQHKR